MRLRGLQLLRSVLRGGNTVVKLGPIVIKHVGEPNARGKYLSERIARAMLREVGIDVVPIVLSTGFANVIIMRRAARPTLDQELSESALTAFGEHVVDLAQRALPSARPAGYYWVGTARPQRCYASFADFLLGEFAPDEGDFVASFPAFDIEELRSVFKTATASAKRVVVPTDVAPKNVVYTDGRFAHLDLETVLVGPPEFLLMKAAVNLATDLGDLYGARDVRRRILDHCHSQHTARASLVFSVVRRMLYEARANRPDPRPGAALRAVLDGCTLEHAVTRLEGKWGHASLAPVPS